MKLTVHIEKRLRDFTLAADFTLHDSVLALLGASGSGKSMTLRCIAGLARPDRGQIVLNGRTLYDSEKKIDLPPQARHVGYLFQSYALFPNMTVRKNITFALSGTRADKERILAENITRFSLEGLEDAYPANLSGGQQQRVAFARILARGAELLLLDEPLSALDTHLKWQIEMALKEMLETQDMSAILVTHDRDEAFRIAKEIATIEKGHLAPPMDKHVLFQDPGTRAGAMLTGCKNISAARRINAASIEALDWGITLRVPKTEGDVQYIAVRAHYLTPAEGGGENVFPARIAEVIESTFSYIVLLRFADGAIPVRWELDKEAFLALDASRDDTLYLRFPPEALMLLRA